MAARATITNRVVGEVRDLMGLLSTRIESQCRPIAEIFVELLPHSGRKS